MFTTTVTVLSFTDGLIIMTGTGLTQAEADAEVASKLAIMVGKQVVKVQRSIPGDVADFALYSTAATEQYENVEINVTKANPDVPGRTITRDIQIPNVSLDFKQTGTRKVAVGVLTTAIATTYRDGRGEGGYAYDSGTFNK